MKSLSLYPICKLISYCHSFMNACWRQETPGSEGKDMITPGTAGSVNFMFTMFLFHREAHAQCEIAQEDNPVQWVHLMAEKLWVFKWSSGTKLKGITLLKGTANKPAQPLSGVLYPRGRPHIFQDCLLDGYPSKDSSEKTVSASGHKTHRNGKDPWRIVF